MEHPRWRAPHGDPPRQLAQPPCVPLDEQVLHELVASAVLAPEGALVRVNNALSTLVGRPAADLAGADLPRLCATDVDREAVTGLLRAAGTGEQRGDVALRLAGGDGSPVPVRAAWTAVRTCEGALSCVALVLTDDTERVRAEERAAAAERRCAALLAHAGDVVWTAGPDGRPSWVAPALTTKLGWSPEDVVGRPPHRFVHPEDLPACRAALDRVLSGASRQQVLDCRVRRRDGGWTWIRETLTDLREDPEVRAVVGRGVDISEQRRNEQTEAAQEARFRARFHRSRVPQLLVDREGELAEVNEAFCALVDRPAPELVGRPLARLAHPDDDGRARAALEVLLRGEQEALQVEAVLLGPDGTPVPVVVDATALRDACSRPEGVAAFLHDLTGLREEQRRRQVQEEFFAVLSSGASELTLVGDAEGRLLYASPAVERVFGYRAQDVEGLSGWSFVHPEDVDAVRRSYDDVVRQGGTCTSQCRVRVGDGAWRWVEQTAANFLDTAVAGIVCNLRDITERVEAERRLRESELRYRAIADTAEEGIWAVTPDGHTLYANGRMARLLGVPLRQVYERSTGELLGDELGGELALRRSDRHRRGPERYEVGYRHPDGCERRLWVSATPLRLADGTVEGSLTMVSDVTDARRTERELRHAALHDGLTGLANRTLLLDRLQHALAREDCQTAVLCLDLDHFKLVNDSRGHAAADQLLVAVAGRLAEVAGPRATVARTGGDEFVVVCEDADAAQAHQVAQRLLDALAAPLPVEGGAVHVGASVGMAVCPPRSATDLLRYADMAMYAAKASGRGRIRLFDAGLADEAEGQYALAEDLRAALAEDALALHYQPVVDLHTGRVVGMEALARWEHPEHGSVPPVRFVAVAELTGLAGALDRWSLRRALREAGRLRAHGVLPPETYVAVNLSARNLGGTGLDELVAGWAEEAGLPPEQVVLEITETAIMADPTSAIGLLGRLRARGFQVAVDDFGTGYSSLAYLRDLPITSLKIDRSFVADIAGNQDALAIVASIVELARAIDVGVVAEGVETVAQAELLRDLGCGLGQGWLWTPALPPEAIEASPQWRDGYGPPADG